MASHSLFRLRSMHRLISREAWTLSIKDHGWEVSDCTAEDLRVNKFNFSLSE
ncbi:hypothetical protein Peur_036506 [Populus x canadensis]